MAEVASPGFDDLAGQVVLVTGGARGIGRAVVLAFAAAGCETIFCYRGNHEAAAAVVREASALGRQVSARQADVADRAAVDALVAQVQADFGRIDVLVNNAGYFPTAAVVDIDDDAWDEVIRTNLYGVFYTCRAVLPAMYAANRGAIVNLASVAGQRGSAFHAHYAAAKGGVIAFTRSLAREAIQHQVRVNAVAPGRVATELLLGTPDPQEMARWMADTPAQRLATPEEVATAVLFLASGASSYIVGETLAVNGGLLMD